MQGFQRSFEYGNGMTTEHFKSMAMRDVQHLAGSGWVVFELPSGIRSKADFCQVMRETFPLDPPLHTDHWDALSDSLWSAIDSLNKERVCIVWRSPDEMRRAAPQDYEIAVEVLSDVAETLGRPEFRGGAHPIDVLLVQSA